MLASGHRIAGRYHLHRLLAQGGMGSVWVAHDTQLGREVAVKVMVPAAFALRDLVARFEREARAAAQIRSAHVVQIFDHGFDGEQPFIVMELLEGEDLAARLQRVGRLSLDETIRIVSDVCKALRSAHDLCVVHRDLKPANVFLARQDDGEVVKVLDFGVAKLTGTGADATNSHALLGTPHYMAPEQARDTGSAVDHRADLWALGVIAYRALTGRLPFPGESPVMVLVAVASQTAQAPSSIAPELGPEVDRFFAVALARERHARFQSAQALREAFTRLGSRASLADARLSRPSDPDGPNETLPIAVGAFDMAAGQASPLPFARQGSPISAAPATPSEQPLSHLKTTLPLIPVAASFRRTMPLSPVPQGLGGGPRSDPSQQGVRPDEAASSRDARATLALDALPTPPPILASEPTPAALSSTGASGSVPQGKRNWIAWLAGGAALLAVAVVAVSVLTAGSGAAGGDGVDTPGPSTPGANPTAPPNASSSRGETGGPTLPAPTGSIPPPDAPTPSSKGTSAPTPTGSASGSAAPTPTGAPAIPGTATGSAAPPRPLPPSPTKPPPPPRQPSSGPAFD